MKLSEIAELKYPCIIRVIDNTAGTVNTLHDARGSFTILAKAPQSGDVLYWIRYKHGVTSLEWWYWSEVGGGNPEIEVEVVDVSTIRVEE